MARLYWYLDPLSPNQLKYVKKSWTPSEKKHSGSAHELQPLSSVVVVGGGVVVVVGGGRGGGGGGGYFLFPSFFKLRLANNVVVPADRH